MPRTSTSTKSKPSNKCKECMTTIGNNFFDKLLNKKRLKCCECDKYSCPNCYKIHANRCNNCYQVSCQIIDRRIDTYTGLSNLPVKTLKKYILEVVQMTKVDIDRTLTEKTDFVDKIIQFKGINPEKDSYLASIHQTSTAAASLTDVTSGLNLNSQHSREGHGQTPGPDGTRSVSVPIMTPTSPENLLDNDNRSINSSISTGSEGFEVEGTATSTQPQSPSTHSALHSALPSLPACSAPIPAAGRKSSANANPQSSSTSKRIKIESRPSETSNASAASNRSGSTVVLGQELSESNISTVSSAPVVLERERMVHQNLHDNEGTPKHQTYKVEDLHDNELLRLQKYSVKELKNFLNAESVNYSGLIEKHELYEKAKNLIMDRRNNEKILKEQTEDNPNKPEADVEKDVCKVCWDATINCVLLECGHMCACINCSKKLMECPICRQHVVRCVHVFRV